MRSCLHTLAESHVDADLLRLYPGRSSALRALHAQTTHNGTVQQLATSEQPMKPDPTDCPLFSVIIPTYNVQGCLRRAIDSVMLQSRQDFEILIIDDASRDGTVALATAMAASDGRIRVFPQEENHGPSVARNVGLNEARGAWIAVLDADDAFEPDRLDRLYTLAVQHAADVVADNLVLFDQGVERKLDVAFDWPAEHMLSMDALLEQDVYMRGSPLGWIKPLFKKPFLDAHGLRYPPQYRHAEDFYLLACLILSGARFWLTPDAGYIYTLRVGAISGKASPYSASVPNMDSIVASCDDLLRRFQGQLTPQQRRLIETRKTRFKAGQQLDEVMSRFRAGRYGRGAAALLTRSGARKLILERLARALKKRSMCIWTRR